MYHKISSSLKRYHLWRLIFLMTLTLLFLFPLHSCNINPQDDNTKLEEENIQFRTKIKELNKKIETLEAVTFEDLSEATTFLDFYLDVVQSELIDEVKQIVNNKTFQRNILGKLNKEAHEFMVVKLEDVVLDNRGKVDIFTLVNKQQFNLFLRGNSPFKDNAIRIFDSDNPEKQKIEKKFQTFKIEQKEEKLVDLYEGIVIKLIRDSKITLTKELETIYSNFDSE